MLVCHVLLPHTSLPSLANVAVECVVLMFHFFIETRTRLARSPGNGIPWLIGRPPDVVAGGCLSPSPNPQSRPALLAALCPCLCLVIAAVAGGDKENDTDVSVSVLQEVTEGKFPARFGAGVVWHQGFLFVMGGASTVSSSNSSLPSYVYYNDVYRSRDRGVSWETLTTAPWTQRTEFGVVSFGDNLYVYGGKGPLLNIPFLVTCLNDVWLTPNAGLTWSLLTFAG